MGQSMIYKKQFGKLTSSQPSSKNTFLILDVFHSSIPLLQRKVGLHEHNGTAAGSTVVWIGPTIKLKLILKKDRPMPF